MFGFPLLVVIKRCLRVFPNVRLQVTQPEWEGVDVVFEERGDPVNKFREPWVFFDKMGRS